MRILAGYLAMRIKSGNLNYNAVIAKYPQFKEDINLILGSDRYIVSQD